MRGAVALSNKRLAVHPNPIQWRMVLRAEEIADAIFQIIAADREVVDVRNETQLLQGRLVRRICDEEGARSGDLEVFGDDVTIAGAIGESGTVFPDPPGVRRTDAKIGGVFVAAVVARVSLMGEARK